MKKLVVALLAITLVLTPLGNLVFNEDVTVEAKGYKSGKKGFNINNNNNNNNNSNIQKNQKNKATIQLLTNQHLLINQKQQITKAASRQAVS